MRSPFQGNYQPNRRPTVVTAPDALVYINGEQDLVGCPSCKRKFDVSKYITSIQINLDVDSVPGSASISLSIPRHALDDFFFDGVPVLSPMMEIEIFGKGYYLIEGVPQYYPIFWGLITEVTDAFSGGETTVSISCADILKWWEICRMNVNPSFTAPTPQLGRSIFGNVLFGTNPYDCIFSLAQMAFGDVILGTGSLVSLYKEAGQQSTFNASLGDIMQYWSSRFSRIRSNLLLYGVNGIAVRGDTISAQYERGNIQIKKGFTPIASAVRNANGGDNSSQLVFDPTDPGVTAFRTQFSQAGEINFWQSEYQTKLEIANACKEAAGFEFFMDVTGDIVFKPPFYNLDILANKPVSWIQDIDIIDWNFSDSESEVVTQLTIQGSFAGNVDYGFGPEITPFTSVTDYHLLRKYGWRPHTYNSEFMGDTLRMFYHGLDMLDRMNSRRHHATVTIPFRPELRLGFPIYIPAKDQIWYVKGISHNVQFGGRATTSLTLTARRAKFLAPKGIATLKKDAFVDSAKKTKATKEVSDRTDFAYSAFKLELGEAGTVPPTVDPKVGTVSKAYEPLILRHPKTGRMVGYPNVVMVYTRPYNPDPATHSIASGRKKPGQNKAVKKNVDKAVRAKQNQEINQVIQQFTDKAAELQNKYSHNRYSFGLNSAGVYVYAHDQTKKVNQFSLIPTANITVTKDGQASSLIESSKKVQSPSAMVRPVSDERGFEVVGHYRYGRGVALRDGSLILNEGKTNSRASIDIPLALSGDLSASLEAASKGLTTVSTAYASPADAVARLQPEDLETAATIQPGDDKKRVAFSNTGKNFVDSAPLGSAEAKGLQPSVEAAQFSRALTLAEMTVKNDPLLESSSCECVYGRSDLSFINVGYKVQPNFTASNPESASLSEEGGLFAGEAAFGNLDAEALAKPLPADVRNPQEILNQVENYLFTLYKALDDVHQPYEEALRGNPKGQTISTTRPNLFEPPTNFGNFEPPFSSPNRASLGDPVADAQQAISAKENLAQSFENFGKDLQKQVKKSEISTDISRLRSDLNTLKTKLKLIQSGTQVQGETVESLTQQIVSIEQQLNQKQRELDLLG